MHLPRHAVAHDDRRRRQDRQSGLRSHGVDVGARCWLSAGAAVAGHATLGDGALLGIGSIVVDNVELEPGVRTSGGSVVTRNAAAGTSLQGFPAHAVAAMRRFGPTPRD